MAQNKSAKIFNVICVAALGAALDVSVADAQCAALTESALGPSTTLLNFEVDPQGVPLAYETPLENIYTSLGVTFDSTDHIGGGSFVSPPNLAKGDAGAGFAPINAVFSAPVTQVGAWGFDFDIEVFDAAGISLGSGFYSGDGIAGLFGPNEFAFLGLQCAATIARVQFRHHFPNQATYGYNIDNFSFGRACGNGTVDAGEQCDDGNDVGGDCCSADCQYEPSGGNCEDDGNACTDDICDGGGVCTHLNNAASCDDGDACTNVDACLGGSCIGLPVACGNVDGCCLAGCGADVDQDCCAGRLDLSECEIRPLIRSDKEDRVRLRCQLFSAASSQDGINPVDEPIDIFIDDTGGRCFADVFAAGTCADAVCVGGTFAGSPCSGDIECLPCAAKRSRYVCKMPRGRAGLTQLTLRQVSATEFRVRAKGKIDDLGCTAGAQPWTLGLTVGDDCGATGPCHGEPTRLRCDDAPPTTLTTTTSTTTSSTTNTDATTTTSATTTTTTIGTPVNVALGKPVSASRFYSSEYSPSKAVDGDIITFWNSGEYAPQWIEIDLLSPISISRLRFRTGQSPSSGYTVHAVTGRAAIGDPYQALHTFEGVTVTETWIEYAPPTPWESIRYLRIETLESPSWVAWVELEAYH